MVEAAIGLRSFLEVSPVSSQTQELKLPFIQCSEKTVQLHNNNKISIKYQDKTQWMNKKTKLSKFLDRNFTQIEKIEILKKIFHGIHTPEREYAFRYLKLLPKEKSN